METNNHTQSCGIISENPIILWKSCTDCHFIHDNLLQANHHSMSDYVQNIVNITGVTPSNESRITILLICDKCNGVYRIIH